MGGERRRRRLRRAGRGPAIEQATEPAAGPATDPSSESAELTGTAPDGPEPAAAGPAPNGPEPAAAAAAGTATSAAEARPAGDPRRRNGSRGPRPEPPTPPPQHRPSPADLAERSGSFALTAGVHDPEPPAEQPAPHAVHFPHADDPSGERGLRGLVGGGSSQVNVAAAMRARDASRPSDAHVAAAEADLPIVRRGWVPREELPRR
jgi:hypothetical protein